MNICVLTRKAQAVLSSALLASISFWGCGLDTENPSASPVIRVPRDTPLSLREEEAVEPGTEQETPTVEPTLSGFLFTSVDADFKSSGLSFYDTNRGEIIPLLDGGGSDPHLVQLKPNHILLLQRAGAQRNVREIWIREEAEPAEQFKLSEEVALPADMQQGDPQDALLWKDETLLLAESLGGRLRRLVWKSSAHGALPFDSPLPALPPLGQFEARAHPTQLGRTEIAGKSILWLLHQELEATGGSLRSSEQKLFVWAEEDSVASEIPLGKSVANRVFTDTVEQNKVWVELMCSAFVLPPVGQASCPSKLVQIDLLDRVVSDSWDFTSNNLRMNGPIIRHPLKNLFYRMAEHVGEGHEWRQGVQLLDPEQRKTETLHTFPKNRGGFFALAMNPDTETLFIGERRANGKGAWILRRADSSLLTSPDLPRIPYQAIPIFRSRDIP